ncbi:MAG: phosphatase [Clostridiales bacterium]|nr:phosphatase [Clostridiales bacterium]
MIYALVDVGANSIRLSIYEAEQGSAKLLINKKDTAGLSSYVKDGALSRDGIKKACRVLTGFRAILENFGIADVHVFATASLRNISNTQEAVDQIEAETGFFVDVLSGAEEARLDFIGISHTSNIRDGILIDIGGGSTELAEFSGGEVLTASSMPVGSLNLFLRHVRGILPNDKMCREIRAEVENELDQLVFAGKKRYSYLYGIGGTIRATAKLANQMFELPDDNQEISYRNLNEILRTYKTAKDDVQRSILQTSPERVHTLVPGMILLRAVAKRFQGDIILANNSGVREGYLFAKVLGKAGERYA